MIDKFLIFLSSLMIAIVLAIVSLDYPNEYNIVIGIIAATGSIIAIVQFLRNK